MIIIVKEVLRCSFHSIGCIYVASTLATSGVRMLAPGSAKSGLAHVWYHKKADASEPVRSKPPARLISGSRLSLTAFVVRPPITIIEHE